MIDQQVARVSALSRRPKLRDRKSGRLPPGSDRRRELLGSLRLRGEANQLVARTDRRGRSIHRRARALQDRDRRAITGSLIGVATR